MTSAYPLGKTDWAEAQIWGTGGEIWASGAPSGFAEVRFAEVLHPQIIQESQKRLSPGPGALPAASPMKARFTESALCPGRAAASLRRYGCRSLTALAVVPSAEPDTGRGGEGQPPKQAAHHCNSSLGQPRVVKCQELTPWTGHPFPAGWRLEKPKNPRYTTFSRLTSLS